ncbi:hypothetical protein ACQI4F_15620 [Mycolicibacterium vaccae]|uniref:hypothetical protein n=1 Tax=Mycolicibacterium vaccae TaxID=1810 RepID=UPI003CED464F
MTRSDGARLGADAASRLAELGSVTLDPGLRDDEFDRVEAEFGVEFADDHRAFLAAVLPVGPSWPDWRGEGRRSLGKRMQLPAEGVLFAVEWQQFWPEAWGRKPARMKDALRSARYHLARVPQLIPLYSHHYLPAGRGSSRRPVLSVVRTDVTVVGADLADYIEREFGSRSEPVAESAVVPFWSELVS